MKFRDFHLSVRSRACLASLFLLAPAFSEELDLAALVDGSRTAIDTGKWDQALDFNSRAIARYGQGNALASYGPQFGAVFYQKGICELKLKRWKGAMQSFETCYRDFPNQGTAAENGNPYEKLALLKWGEAAMGAEQWDLAISRFKKFTEERDRTRDTFPQGSFHVSLAICECMTGHLAEGSENLEIAIRNKDVFPTPDDGIIAGFQALVRAVIQQRNEQVLLDFIGKNRGELTMPLCRMHRYSQVFMKLAADAADAGMRRSALALYPFVPATDEVIDDIRARLKSLGPASSVSDGRMVFARQELEADLTTLEAERRGPKPVETIKLAAIAVLHEAAGNRTGALAAYRQLETHYPNAENREINLLNLIRLSTLAASGGDVPALAETFFKSYTDSPHRGEVTRLMLSSLFAEGRYEECSSAEAGVSRLKPGTADHDFCTYILGAAAFHAGNHEKAAIWLDRHMEAYPTGEWSLPGAYFQASNAARLGQPGKAAGLLDRFLTDHPDPKGNPYLAAALYECAVCHVALKQPAEALKKIERILKTSPDGAIADSAWYLKATLEQASGNAAAAEKDFLTAYQAATASGDRITAGETLLSLVELLGRNGKRAKEAAAHADRFWKDHASDSPFRNRMAIAEVPALTAAGRAEDAMARLRTAISQTSKQPDSGELPRLIDIYTAAFLKRHSPDELARHLETLPGIDPANRAVRASLRMAVIGAYETAAEKAPDESRRQAAAAAVRTLFQKFKTEFPIKELASRDLLRLGDFLHLKTSTPREALGYYDEVIARDNPRLRFAALLGRGDVRSHSSVDADLAASLADFETVYQKSGDRAERDYAWFRVIGLMASSGDPGKAAAQAQAYLSNPDGAFTDFVPQVKWLLSKSLDDGKQTDAAIDAYGRLWKEHPAEIAIAAPALARWMQLSWEHTPATRPAICEAAAGYLARVGSGKSPADGPLQEVAQLLDGYRKTLAKGPSSTKPIAE